MSFFLVFGRNGDGGVGKFLGGRRHLGERRGDFFLRCFLALNRFSTCFRKSFSKFLDAAS